MKKLGLLLAGLCVVAMACERKSREIGGSHHVKISAPAYTVQANVSEISGVSYVEEVFPKAQGGAPDGKAVFDATCLACHQANGQGIPGAFPPLDGSPYVTSDKVE